MMEENKAYIGSSTLSLAKLEDNHRNASTKVFNGKPANMTRFRTKLKEGLLGYFIWIIKPALRTEEEILKLEQRMLEKYLPDFNLDYTPYQTKIEQGYDLDETKRYRGVYAFIAK